MAADEDPVEDLDRQYDNDQEQEQMAQEEAQYRQMVEEELQEHGIQSFFEVPYEYQQVIFMMVKGDNEGLQNSRLYNEQSELFNYYLELIVRFS